MRLCLKCRTELPATHRGNYCRTCWQKQTNEHRKQDPVRKMYDQARWLKLRDMLIGHGNVFCQRILDDGRRCGAKGEIWHHLISPRNNPALFVDHRNLVNVCRTHHPKDAGDPGYLYVPTLYTPPMAVFSMPEWYPQPGAPVPKECPRWSVNTVRELLKPGTQNAPQLQGGTVSSVPSGTHDAALGDPAYIAELIQYAEDLLANDMKPDPETNSIVEYWGDEATKVILEKYASRAG